MGEKPKRFGILLGIVLIAAASFHLGAWEAAWYLALTRAFLVVAAFLILCSEGRRRHLHSLQHDPGQGADRYVEIPPRHAHKLQALAAKKRFSTTMMQGFALAVIAPTELRQRVVETYTPTRRTLDQKVTVDVQVPSRYTGRRTAGVGAGNGNPAAERIAFPVIMPPKGMLLDNLDIYDAEHKHVAALTYREYLLLAACTLRTFLLSAYKSQQLPAEAKTPEYQALLAIIERNNPGTDREQWP